MLIDQQSTVEEEEEEDEGKGDAMVSHTCERGREKEEEGAWKEEKGVWRG